jgi:beta-glucosidase
MPDFPSDFTFGVSTSAYQIEGGARDGARGESVWDRFSHLPGNILNGGHGDVACDHYHRVAEDVALMSELGLDAYRFSTSWSRIFPDGRGALNRPGLDFYDRLIDTLLEREIEPWVCYHHFDLPQKLQNKGGWANRDVAYWYADYVGELGARIKDRVSKHILINEPSILSMMTSLLGTRYETLSTSDVHHATMHHLNLASGLGAQVLRELGPELKIGTALEAPWIEHARDEEDDFFAAEKARDWLERAYLDPLLKGTYPEAVYERLLPYIHDGDLKLTCQGLDFLGLNHYTRKRILSANNKRGFREAEPEKDAPLSEMGLEIWPEGVSKMALHLSEAYPDLDLFITENGGAFPDEPDASGFVTDTDRIDYLAENLNACLEAIGKGANLKGYFVWSLLDNFEWTFGYERTFGLVRVDFNSLARIPKASYAWYRDVVQSRRLK